VKKPSEPVIAVKISPAVSSRAKRGDLYPDHLLNSACQLSWWSDQLHFIV